MSNYILKYKPNIIECSTNTLNLIINNKKFNSKNLSYLDLIICSKEKLNNSLKDKIIEFLDKHNSSALLKSTFGMKESTSNIAITDENTSDSIGNPYPNVNINIFNNEKECKPLEIGEICINGPIVMDSYLNDIKSDKFLKKHKNNTIWLHSGDLGYKDSNGFIYFKSSIKRVIISNDNDIYPSDIENIILAHPYVKGCSIVGVPHPYKKEVVKAYIVLKDGLILNSEIKKSIKEYCEKNIAEYALPYAYAYRKELPKTISGKVSYQKLVSDKDEEE
jgi:long-chain acyl-CoA synthetase